MSVFAGALDRQGGAGALAAAIKPNLAFVVADAEADWQDADIAIHAKRLAVDQSDRAPLLAPVEAHVVVAIDGHIYNLDELRRTLNRAADATPEQLIAAAWEKWGDDFLARLNGEFALAAWNLTTRRLLLAVDHVATIPLYWTELSEGRFAFSTELSAVVAARDAPPQPDWCKIADFLANVGAERNRTFVRDIASVAPGCAVAIAGDDVRNFEYWRYCDPARTHFVSLGAGIEACRAALDEAVRVRLPDGAQAASHLTGGLDSSSIAALAARRLAEQGRPLHLFSIVPWLPGEGQGPSDADFIPAFLRDYPQCHHQYLIGEPGHSRYGLPGLCNGPLNLQLTPAIQTLSRRALDAGCRVTLSGWGGEASVTYPGHLAYRAALHRGEWGWLVAELRAQGGWRARAAWLQDLFAGAATSPMDRAGPRLWPLLEQCLEPDFVRRYDMRARCLDPYPRSGDPLHHGLARMLAGVLRQGRLGAWSYQARAEGFRYRHPLLDRRLLEAVEGLPASAHLSAGRGRELVRRVLADFLPAEIYSRRSKFSPIVATPVAQLRREFLVPDSELFCYLDGVVRRWPDASMGAAHQTRDGIKPPDGLVADQLRKTAEFVRVIDQISKGERHAQSGES